MGRASRASPCDVLGAGDVANDDEAVLIVAPTNRAPTWRRERAPRTPESPVEPDALKLKSFQALVARALAAGRLSTPTSRRSR